MKVIYKLTTEYTDMPGGRYIKDGDYSGEHFRDSVLISMLKKCLNDKTKLVIDLDGGFGYPPSFLEEAFGGIIRTGQFTKDDVLKNIEFISREEPYLIEKIYGYIKAAKKNG